MGVVDDETKKYVKRPEIFADLFNHLIYDGQSVINPDNLFEKDTTEIFIPFDDKGKAYPVQKYRDVLKNAVVMQDDNAAYALILGAENQTDIHYAMPVRNMGYDAYNYAAQVSSIADKNKKSGESGTDFLSGLKKDDKITPVITLVVYFGQKAWDGPMSIHDMLATQDPGILKFVPDYKINIISPVSMDMSEIEKFTTSFRELATFIRCGKDKNAIKKLVENNERFRHMDYVAANIANAVTGAGLNLKVNEKGEVDMCVAIAGIREDSRAEGRAEGMAEGRVEGEMQKAIAIALKMINRGKMTLEEIAEDSGLSLSKVKELKNGQPA